MLEPKLGGNAEVTNSKDVIWTPKTGMNSNLVLRQYLRGEESSLFLLIIYAAKPGARIRRFLIKAKFAQIIRKMHTDLSVIN